MDVVWNYIKDTMIYVLNTLLHSAPILALGILTAAAMQVYVNTDKLKSWLMRRSSVSIPASVAFGAFTPFCACGTMAVVISMLATALPWGPVMAFLTSSPLMSPDGFVLLTGIIGPAFAAAVGVSSVVIGLGSGYITHLIERKTKFLDGQLRLLSSSPSSMSCGCGYEAAPAQECVCRSDAAADKGCCGSTAQAAIACGCDTADAALRPERGFKSIIAKFRPGMLIKAVFDLGVKRILPYFAAFAAIGYFINNLIPAEWISALFGKQSALSVPLAALVGLPLYVNGDSSIPMIRSLLESGVAPGAMLAFLITGPGTSAGVIAGIATIMKKRALVLYTAFLLAGAIILGYAYELISALM